MRQREANRQARHRFLLHRVTARQGALCTCVQVLTLRSGARCTALQYSYLLLRVRLAVQLPCGARAIRHMRVHCVIPSPPIEPAFLLACCPPPTNVHMGMHTLPLGTLQHVEYEPVHGGSPAVRSVQAVLRAAAARTAIAAGRLVPALPCCQRSFASILELFFSRSVESQLLVVASRPSPCCAPAPAAAGARIGYSCRATLQPQLHWPAGLSQHTTINQ
jgi:hypothetical protein